MAIATRPKPTVSHKKRRAQHHRQDKPYLKAYFPYIPMLLIVGLGALANHFWPKAIEAALVPSELLDSDGQPLTRIQTILDNPSSTLLVVALAITAAAFAVFVFRHWYRIHRMISRSEKFVAKNPWLDVTIVFVVTVGFVLTR